MQRLRDEASLVQLLARDELSEELISQVGTRLAAFHASAERSPLIAACASFENVRALVSENLEQGKCADAARSVLE